MRKVEIITAEQAAQLVKDNDTITSIGFVSSAHPEALTKALEKRFLDTNTPQNLTYIYAGSQGKRDGRAAEHLAHTGLLKRAIIGHWQTVPAIGKLAVENKIEAYNFSQGTLVHWFRALAGHKLGVFTDIGLETFLDPRQLGGKLNDVTKEDLVKLIEVDGHEQLFYPTFPVNVAFLRGTYADESGNITMDEEIGPFESTSVAQAVHNCGGKVVVQVKDVVAHGSLDPRMVKIPGIYVDYVVVAAPEDHQQTYDCEYDPSLSGEHRAPEGAADAALPMSAKKIIGRRGALELAENAVVNLGVGAPEYVASVAGEEGIADTITLTVEGGAIGGVPQGGARFGSSRNADAIIDHTYQFDFYDGGGLDLCFLGLAEVDINGDVNVSRLGTRITGSGGFTNISSNSKKAVFCGTFTNGVKIQTGDGKLTILEEGKKHKFVNKVTEITFSGVVAGKAGKDVLYVTERAVFALKADGIHLIEVAPGIDVQTQVLDEMDFAPIVDRDADGNVKLMDARIFKDEVMGMTIE